MTRLFGAAILSFLCALSVPVSAFADGFSDVRGKQEFLGLVNGKALTRLGISLNVTPNGQIEGRAFGQPVTGAWRWSDGLFCRDLYFGSRDLGANCQLVQRNGDTLRFISDAGRGQFADLRLK
ncbi:dihydrodipicolinate reductase [Szabonella alba]|uniref:Dihydrodipicolinate reductase n=1 Tax=Szabonella alba TaxID=2804194 RepID=A0A8K0V9P3_9RHOB|nr:dihydrodipicolinate reductase [Szabonella alba]MBL4916956.1 dihydrodipicolinate reductase [Szabonella alba]